VDEDSGTDEDGPARRPSARPSARRRPPFIPEVSKAERPSALRRRPSPLPPKPAPRPKPRPSAERRDDPPVHEGSVVVTGICGRLGRLVARRLHRQEPVIGIDRRPFPDRPKDIVHHQLDLRRKKTRDVFRSGSIRAVVHLGILHDPRADSKTQYSWNVVAFQRLLDDLMTFGIPKLVVLSSANVYGPRPENPQFLTEEAPLLGAQSFSAIRNLVEVDMLAQSFFWRHPDTETVVLRPVHILGGVRNAPSNYLRLERPLRVLGFDPMVQLIHERDVVQSILLALQPGVRGIFNVAGPSAIPVSRVFRILGRRPRTLPAVVASGLLDRMFQLRMSSFPMPELDHIRYHCMVDDTRAREILGFAPQYGLEETVRAVEDYL
jgi:UDP-glucose 4-epimerase